MAQLTLKVEIFGYWQAGTGRGAGAHVDNLTHTDADGLPEIPGRTLKGLLRDAMRQADELGWLEHPGLHRRLFGVRAEQAGQSEPGCIRVGSARLAQEERQWLAGPGRDCIPELFRDLHSTAIDPVSGAARAQSLRGSQVALPVVLQADIETLHEAPKDWQDQLRLCLPLIRAVGSGKTRGLGRARLSLVEVGHA